MATYQTVPVQIGLYKLSKTLGIGSFGKVKLGVHEKTGHRVAVKILNRNKIYQLDMQEKVRREIANLKKFSHPHIIRLYEVIDTPSDIFVVMEFVSGGELFDYIVSRGKLHESEARKFFQQIVAAIDYCHFHGVVHRDLKPENLLLDSNNNIKVADFGLSNSTKDGVFLRTSCGSPNYAAPEVISAAPYPGPEVDVWSCGVILYALLCGNLPFDDENIGNLFRKIKGGIFNLPTHLSDMARHLIRNMLEVEPSKRISMTEIRAHPWFQVNLPPYLALSPAEVDAEGADRQLDRSALQQVVTLGFDGVTTPDHVEMAVMASKNSGWNDVAVAYELIVETAREELRKKEQRLIQSSGASTMKLEMPKPPTFQIKLPGSELFPKSPEDPVSFDPKTLGEAISFVSSMAEQYASALLQSKGVAHRHSFDYRTYARMLKEQARRMTGMTGAGSSLIQNNHSARGVDNSRYSSNQDYEHTRAAAIQRSVAAAEAYSRASANSAEGYQNNDRMLSSSSSSGRDPTYFDAGSKSSQSTARRGRKWYLGIQSKKDPMHIMNEVYRALMAVGFVWKVFSPFHVRCRYTAGYSPGVSNMSANSDDNDSTENVDSMQTPMTCLSISKSGSVDPSNSLVLSRRVKIDLQLYRVQKNIYVMDLQRVTGNIFSYMNLCASLIAELKVPASSSAHATQLPQQVMHSQQATSQLSQASTSHEHDAREGDISMRPS